MKILDETRGESSGIQGYGSGRVIVMILIDVSPSPVDCR